MYRQLDNPIPYSRLASNGAEIRPVATLADEHGGRVHIWIDDHCYQVGLEREDGVRPVTHIFAEAHRALSQLPPPA